MNARKRSIMLLLGTLLCSLLVLSSAFADEVAQSGRTIATKSKDCLVRVKIVAKITVTSEGTPSTNEEKHEVSGTIIDSSGLIVTSLKETDPEEALANAAAEMGEDTKITAQISSMTIVLPDGSETPGKLVLRDKDLDLAFIRPTKALAKPLTAVDLSKSSKPELLDQVIIIYRLGPIANRVLNATVDRVEAIIDKPRRQYILGLAGYASENGSPVFTLDGNIVGILLNKVVANSQEDDQLYIVLPAEDIADAAAQAPSAADAAAGK